MDRPEPARFPGGGRYHRLAPALAARFGAPVRRVVLRAGFGCPNRDGRLGQAGCAFCSPLALIPRHGPPAEAGLEAQLEHALARNLRRHGARLAVAYFQDGTATDGPPARLRALFDLALAP
ncbi:MAG TPA: TIGR01212 family radical SAM protein, partial [Myxococcota bacterium]|nr:TIGR01212 family radical SAM protein [Myxococcota bacterium]